MRCSIALAASALLACTAAPSARIEPVIFGADDRIELFETDAVRRDLFARAVPALVHRGGLSSSPAGIVTLASQPFGPSHGLCAGEAHFDQPSAASCSGTLIDDRLVLTAGHCVDAIGCADQRWVFGWYYEDASTLHTIDVTEVFSCTGVVAYSGPGAGDFAIVELAETPDGPPADVRLDPVVVGETTSLAGFPFGLPMKVVEMGPITALGRGDAFFARLDAQPGNSGSGVFDAELRVVGESTNGPVEALVDDGGCARLAVIGEDTTRTETVRPVTAAVAQLCASGFASERLCGTACGDGVCAAGEGCPADCNLDAPPLDASATAPDAGPRRDTGAVPPDAGRPRLVPGGSGGCGCRTARSEPNAFVGLGLAVAFGLRRRARLRPPQRARSVAR